MKRCLSLLCLLLAVVLLPSAAMAMSQAEWNQECRSKTSGETTLYAVGNENALTIEEAQLTVVGSLPGGTYIKTGSYHRELGMWSIAYWQNGGRASAWIMRDSITDATRWVYYTDGSGDPLPEALANDRAALERYIQRMNPDKVIYGDGTKPVSIDGSLPLEKLPEEETNKKPDAGTKPSAKKSTSKSSAPKAEKLELSLTMEVPEGKQLAVIHTPNSGKCTLREKASESGKTIKQSKAGHLVLVLEKGDKYTKINDNGYVGYVQTRCLRFFEELPQAIGTAKLSYNGKATGKTTVNIRHEASKSSRKVEEWRTGTTVTVFSYADGWYEIEHNGVYGFVMDDFLTMND